MASDYKPGVVPDLAAIAADPAAVSELPAESVVDSAGQTQSAQQIARQAFQPDFS